MAAVSSVYLISIHALREEGDRDYLTSNRILPLFLSTPSARRATAAAGRMSARRWKFLSTPSARRATPQGRTCNLPCRISIHALREEGDQREVCEELGLSISIHALREEGDAALNGDHAAPLISIHALREEGDSSISFSKRRARISIHALREEGDNRCSRPNSQSRKFLSTPSARRATMSGLLSNLANADFYPRPPRGGRRSQASAKKYNSAISIHALREEGDAERTSCKCERYVHFYPRPPRGGRLSQCSHSRRHGTFLSTPSARRATPFGLPVPCCSANFYPRPPRGGRPIKTTCDPSLHAFLSTPSARRATPFGLPVPCCSANFYPRPPRGGRPTDRTSC